MEQEALRYYRVDPRIALLVLIPLNAGVTLYPHIGFQIASMALILMLMLICRRPFSALKWMIAYLLIFFFAHLPGISGWEWLSSLGSMLLMFQRVFPVAAFASLCLATTRSGEFACALQKLGLPSKLIVSLCVALRFVPTLAHEFKAVAEVAHPARTVEHLMVPVIGRLGIIADELGNAVVARGADTNRKRSSYYDLHIQVIDIALLIIEYALFAAMVLAKIGVGVL